MSNSQTALTRILDIWNDTHYVQSTDLSDPRNVFFALYGKDGLPKKSRQGFPVARWASVKIHRDNIARIGP